MGAYSYVCKGVHARVEDVACVSISRNGVKLAGCFTGSLLLSLHLSCQTITHDPIPYTTNVMEHGEIGLP